MPKLGIFVHIKVLGGLIRDCYMVRVWTMVANSTHDNPMGLITGHPTMHSSGGALGWHSANDNAMGAHPRSPDHAQLRG